MTKITRSRYVCQSIISHSKKVAIVGGGKLSKKSLPEIIKSDYIIGVDRGACWLIANSVIPDIAIGDFDSVSSKELEEIKKRIKMIKKYPSEKNATDMELAVEHALSLLPMEVAIYGAIGSRIDHTMGDIYLLERLLEKGIPAVIRDSNNEARVVSSRLVLKKEPRHRFVSVLPITETIEVTLTGFLYDVSRTLIRRGQTLGVSNEIRKKNALIEVHRGKALVIRSRD